MKKIIALALLMAVTTMAQTAPLDPATIAADLDANTTSVSNMIKMAGGIVLTLGVLWALVRHVRKGTNVI